MESEELKIGWRDFCQMTFPSEVVGEEVEGIDLVSTDSFAAGCISSFLENHRLEAETVDIPADCMADLQKAIPMLSGDSLQYFLTLQKLGNGVLIDHRNNR